MQNRVDVLRRGFMLSASFPAVALLAVPAHAQETVTIDSATTAPVVNAKINTAVPAESDLKIVFTGAAQVAGPGNVTLIPAAGNGDGAIAVDSAGKIGAIDADGVVTDSVGLALNGAGATKAGNTLVLNNSGLITGGLVAGSFGGSVGLTNSGTIYGGVGASSFGNVKIDHQSAGAVRSGGVQAGAISQTASKVDGDVTTTTTTGGAVEILAAGDIVSIDGKTKGNVGGTGVAAASVTVEGVAGNVFASSTPTFTVVTVAPGVPAVGKTVTTLDETKTRNTGSTASVTIAETASVGSVTALAGSEVSVNVAGAARGNVTGNYSGQFSTVTKATETQDADGKLVANSFDQSKTYTGPATKVVIAATGTVGVKSDTETVISNVSAFGLQSAAIENAGVVTGGLTASTTNGTNNTTSSSATTYKAGGDYLTSATKTISELPGGIASIVNTGRADGSASAFGPKGATLANSGTIGGSVSVNAANTKTVGLNEFVGDGAGATVASKFTTTRSATGGEASVVNGKGGVIRGGVSATGDAGASVVNTGIVGDDTAPTFVNATSNRDMTVFSESASTADGSSFKEVSSTVGGAASVKNEAGGLINGNITVSGATGATVANAGTVRGQTSAFSFGSVRTFEASNATKTATDAGITTTQTKASSSNAFVQTGGSVSGSYSGVNGTLNFEPRADGSIVQEASKDSSATVSGTVFGNLSTYAGDGLNSVFTNASEQVSVLDADTTGTIQGSYGSTYTETEVAGTNSVTISGAIKAGPTGAAGEVDAQGTSATMVLISGSVAGNVNADAPGVGTYSSSDTTTYAQTVTKGVTVTDTLVREFADSSKVTGGDVRFELTGKGSIGGSVDIDSNSSAVAIVNAGTRIGTTASNSSLSVSANRSDTSSSTKQTYAYDAKTGTVTASDTYSFKSAPSATSGDAAATVAGTVTGVTTVSANRGNATATITGVSDDGVSVFAEGSGFEFSEAFLYSGKAAASGATFFGGLPLPALREVTTAGSTTWTGGRATATIDASADLKSSGTASVNGLVSASGVGGATVAVAAGSKVNGSVQALSQYTNEVSQSKQTFGSTTNFTSSKIQTASGSTATVTNAGIVTGSASAFGTSGAEVANTGTIGTIGGGNSVVANTLRSMQSVTTTQSDTGNPATRVDVVSDTRTAVGGDSRVTNAAGAIIQGGVTVAGKTGSVTNSGIIAGMTTLGQSVADYTRTTTKTASTTTEAIVLPTTRFTQTYVANQNGVSGGFNVTGATFANPIGGAALQTSTINATINLNSGSATLGDITAQRSATGQRLTATTVNLNGSGFLGADVLALTPASSGQLLRTPLLSVPASVLPFLSYSSFTGSVFGYTGGTNAVRVLGVETLNKTGNGTFVLVGAPYVAPAAAGALPTWTLDVGNFNITGGEVQLAVIPSGTNTQFGINGNVTNSASLVLGRRVPTSIRVIGDSLVGDGPERIAGITVRQTGNFTQTTGTTVVGITPSLVRFGPVTVPTGGASNEPLGPVSSGVNIPYFTTSTIAGMPTANSRLDLTGNLTLGGTVLVDVTRDSLFVNGDGYTLFTYTGTGAVTATANSTLSSPFVKFALVHDTAAKTVRIQANRLSYATGGTNPNAKAAAAGLDSALPEIVNRIRTDAAGGAGFTSVSQIGFAQDLANIASALDFRLSAAQVAQVFDELSSAEFYGSLSAVNQNAVFGDTVNLLSARRGVGETLGSQLWISPVGNFAKIGGTESGASEIKADSYGAAFGFDFAYLPDGVVGIGGAYAEHKVTADTPERADGRTWTVGMYVTQGFDNFYVNASLAYGFTQFDASRSLSLLSRTMTAEFDANQFDGMLELGYDFDMGGAIITPFAKAAFRSQSFDAFTEANGGGAGVAVAQHDHSSFLPSLGFKVTGLIGDPATVSARPFAKVSYTFQDDIGSDRSVTLLGGGAPFTLVGVNPEGYGTIEAGVDGSLGGRVRLFAGGGYSFGGENSVASLRAGLGFRF